LSPGQARKTLAAMEWGAGLTGAVEQAAALAAYYSKGRDGEKVEIDYIEKKHVKKPAGGKPGFVVYYTNYSMIASPDISTLTLLEE
jgi:predicted ribosome quality control (RQC) complex YloA/Tae2 family protein